MSKELPCFYLFIYRKIREKANGRRVIPYADLMEVFGRTVPQLPKKYRYIVIKEMEAYEMIKQINKHKVHVIGGNIDAKLEKYDHPILK